MDLATRYMGLALRNPLVASASPLSQTVEGIERLAAAGVGAIVLYSLFEEQLQREAEAYDGPSLVLAYSHCVAHGIEMKNGLDQQYRAVASGYWPLIRYDPMVRSAGGNPFLLDSPRPRIPLSAYTERELRYRSLANSDPAEAERLHGLAEEGVAQRWNVYEEMATRGAQEFAADGRREQ